MRSGIKPVLNAIGFLIALTGIGYVAVSLQRSSLELNLNQVPPVTWLMIVLLSTLYAVNNLLLAQGWRKIIEYLGVPTTFTRASRVFGISQIGKYIPGNIFHFASRQMLGMTDGINSTALLKSAVIETVLLILAGAMFAILLLHGFFTWLSWQLSIVLFGSLVLIAFIIMHRTFSRELSIALLCYLLFLFVSGSIFIGSFLVVTQDSGGVSAPVFMMGAFVIAWLVGLLVPGAPAGLGVREVVLLTLLSAFTTEAQLLLAVVLGRLVTAAGDFVYFLFSFLAGKRLESVGT